MDRSLKIIFGIASFFPIVSYLVVCAVVIPNREIFVDLSLSEIRYEYGGWAHIVLIYLVTVVMNIYAMMGYYIYHALTDEELTKTQKIKWAVAVFLGNIVVYPFYFYKRILKKQDRTHRSGNIVLGILTILPLGLVIGLIPIAIILGDLPETAIMTWAFAFDIIFFPTWIYLIVKIIRYKNKNLGWKATWLTLILLFALITMPILWTKHIRTRRISP